jgi:hypothetical protein
MTASTGLAADHGSKTIVTSSNAARAASHAVDAAPTATAIHATTLPRATRSSHQAMASTAHGSACSTWRPGNHQPCMVTATHVATAHPVANGATSTSQRGGRRTASAATPGTTPSHSGCQAASPKSRSTSNPASRRVRPSRFALSPMTDSCPPFAAKKSPLAYGVRPPYHRRWATA